MTVMTLLRQHVPLSLLCDLLEPAGPPSAEIYALEVGGSDEPRGLLLEL